MTYSHRAQWSALALSTFTALSTLSPLMLLGVAEVGRAAEPAPIIAAQPDVTMLARVQALPSARPADALKKAALIQALDQAAAFAQAAESDAAQALLADVEQALPLPLGKEYHDPATLRFLPALKVTDGNPHFTALNAWASELLAKPDISWRASTATVNAFTGTGHDYGTRDEGIKIGTLFWLVAHPQSRYRNNPELFTRMLRRANAYIDAYLLHANKYGDSTNDFFAIGPAAYAWMAIDQVWPDLILPSQRARWNKTLRKCADFWMKVYNDTQTGPYRMGHYTNRDLGVANILLNVGLMLKDQACLDAATFLIDAQEPNLYPDGGFTYIGTQNESTGYHDADITLMTRYWLVTGYDKCRDLMQRTQLYGVLSTEPTLVAEYWTAPSWKHTWNGSVSLGTEVVAGLSGNPYLRWLLDQQAARSKDGGSPDPIAATFYRNDVPAKAVPDNYTVIDRNLQGPRARYGRFSYALTTRVPGADEPGQTTLVGAMTMGQDLTKNYPLSTVLMGAMPKVRAPGGDKKKLDWAWLTRNGRNAVIMGRNYSAISADYGLHQFGSSTKGNDVPWQACQEWICVKDRMIGLMTIAPQGPQQATEVTANVKLGTGGTAGGPPQKMITVDPTTYRYGDLVVKVHDSNFKNHASTDIMVRIKPGYEIVFSDGSGGGNQLKDYKPDQEYFCLIEIRPAAQTTALKTRRLAKGDGLLGLEVSSNGATWTLWHNRSKAKLNVDLSEALVGGGKSSLHRVRTTQNDQPISPAPTRVELNADERVLVVTSADPADHQAGWDTYEAMVKTGTTSTWPPK